MSTHERVSQILLDLHIPKTGGSTLGWIFRDRLGDEAYVNVRRPSTLPTPTSPSCDRD